MINSTRQSKSGIYIREEKAFGLLAYSPFTGLMYAIHPSNVKAVTKWLDNPDITAPSQEYKFSLGAGWATPIEYSRHPQSHLLPNETVWSTVPMAKNPVLINWFLTGQCPLECKYCYAEDLMRRRVKEPTKSDIQDIATSILKLKPLVVVLTGGDPLFSPYLEEAMKSLYGKVGIIIDTSAYTFTPKHLELFKKFKVAVRISLDSERPKQNQRNRPLHAEYSGLAKKNKPTATAALEAICQCLDAGLSVTVQTVATKWNTNDLLSLGDKLYRMGVHSWRIFRVSDSKARHKEYTQLIGATTKNGKKTKGPYQYVFEKLLELHSRNWYNSMAVQVTFNSSPNAVILVGPNGYFYTESNIALEKTIIDDTHPTEPSLVALNRRVNMRGHIDRYFNRTRPDKGN